MRTYRNETLNITIDFYILAAAFLLLVPLEWVCGWFLASVLHELSHMIALRVCGVGIICVSVTASGAKIETEPMLPWQEIVSALAGPFGGFCGVALWRIAPHLSICAFAQSVFNLIPVYPMDGGRVLYCSMHRLFDASVAEKICRYVENAVLIILFFGACSAAVLFRLGYIPVLISLIVIAKCRKIKIPCKPCKQIVQ